MYVDKPMRGHGLMQAIARVNRVFRDKPGGLVVDYLGLAHELKRALATYTESGGTGKTALDQAEAVAVMLEKYEVCHGLFHSFDYSGWIDGTPAERVGLLPAAQEHILAQENGKERCLQAVRELSQAFALAVPHEDAIRIRDDVAFFQAVRSVLAKRADGEARPEQELGLRRSADRLTGGGLGRGCEHLRRCRSRETRYFNSVRRVPGRSTGHETAQSRGGAVAEAVEGRVGRPPEKEPRPGAILRRDAGADHPSLPEPGRRGRASHRGN